MDLIKKLPRFSSLRKFLIEISNRPRSKSAIHCWGKIEVSPETLTRNLFGPENISITIRQVCKICRMKKFEIVSFLKGAWRRDYSPQYVKPKNYRETFCFKERERQTKVLISLRFYLRGEKEKENLVEQARSYEVVENLEILVKSSRGDLSERKRLRRDCAIYRLYRYLDVPPQAISVLWREMEKDLSKRDGEPYYDQALCPSSLKDIIGRIFARKCFKEKCVLKPYLFREALPTRRIST